MSKPSPTETFETRVRQQLVRQDSTVTYALIPKLVADRMKLKGGQRVRVTIDVEGT